MRKIEFAVSVVVFTVVILFSLALIEEYIRFGFIEDVLLSIPIQLFSIMFFVLLAMSYSVKSGHQEDGSQ